MIQTKPLLTLDSDGEWRMATSGRGRVEHRSFLQLSVTHMKYKKRVMI